MVLHFYVADKILQKRNFCQDEWLQTLFMGLPCHTTTSTLTNLKICAIKYLLNVQSKNDKNVFNCSVIKERSGYEAAEFDRKQCDFVR